MRKKLWICLALVLIIPGLLFTVSCTTTANEQEGETSDQPADTPDQPADTPVEPVVGASDGTIKVNTEGMTKEQIFYNEHVYFEFDKASLTAYGQEVLTRKAEFMGENADVYITMEGHCDERGTNEYNLTLGDKRAQSAKSFLIDLGVAANRVSTVSYGEERPADEGSSEEAWAKNRRTTVVSD